MAEADLHLAGTLLRDVQQSLRDGYDGRCRFMAEPDVDAGPMSYVKSAAASAILEVGRRPYLDRDEFLIVLPTVDQHEFVALIVRTDRGECVGYTTSIMFGE